MRKILHALFATLLLFVLAACSPQQKPTLVISAIPDQDPAVLAELYTNVANYLAQELDIPVEYRAAETYDRAVDSFAVGETQLVWFGGLTGVKARSRVDGAQAIIQRDIDENFQSVFVANVSTGLEPFASVEELQQVQPFSFTFGSRSSTSGYLMPLYFLIQANVDTNSFDGPVNFSGSHDNTLDAVQSGEYQIGALNRQVWQRRVNEGTVDTETVMLLFETPVYFDYQWNLHPNITERYGADFTEKLRTAFLNIDGSTPEEAAILQGFGANAFIPTENANYAAIEEVARQIGEIRN